MSQCIGWYNEFKRNMDTLNAPVPENFFDSYDKAIGTIGAPVAAANISPGASAAAVFAGEFGGGTVLVGLAALSASAYAGMAVGSAIVATQNQSTCAMQSRVSYGQVSSFLSKNGIYDSGIVMAEIMRNPRIMGLAA